MIILTENNYKTLVKIPHVKNPQKIPDIVLYKGIFGNTITEKMLNSVEFNKNDQLWISDNPYKSLQ